MSDQIQNSNLVPNADNTISLGSNSNRFSDVYATEFHGVATYSGSSLSISNHNLENLGDVTLSAVTSGDVLVWTGTEWSANSVCNPTHLDNLTDVDTSGVTSGQVLRYNSTSGKWEAQTVTPASIGTTFVTLSDTPSSLTPNAFLKVNAGGTAVENFVDPGYVSNLTTFSTTDLTEGTNLYYTDARFDTRLATKDTDDLAEGTNLYFTNARFNTSLSSKTTDDLTEGTNLYYTDTRFDSRLTTKSTTDLAEGTNLYFTNTRADARINLQTGANLDLSNKSTTDLAEGSNLYYTDARADTRINTIVTKPFVDNLYSGSNETSDDIAEGTTNLYYTNARFDTRLATKSTTDLAEGTNLYFTNARADARITAASINALTDVDTTGATNGKVLKYNGSAWVVADDVPGADTDSIPEGATNLYYTDTRFDSRLATKSTDDVAEGTNFYYTVARANSAIDARLATTTIDSLQDITVTGVTAGQVLKWNGSAWVNEAETGHSNTDSLAEGSTNLYYTTARANSAIDAKMTTTDVLPEGTTNRYFTESRVWNALSGITTDNLPQGVSNEYYTDAKVNARITASNISDLSGINVNGAVNGQALTYSSGNATWRAETLDITKLSDVNFSRPLSKGQELRYNGSNWDNDPSASVNKHNGGNNVSGSQTVDLEYQRFHYIQINGETRLQGTNWKSGVTYTIIVANNSGSSHLLHFRNDSGTLEWTPQDDAHNDVPLPTGSAFRLIVTSLGTSSAEAIFNYELGELSPFFNSSNIGT
jgi:hypothetical protein